MPITKTFVESPQYRSEEVPDRRARLQAVVGMAGLLGGVALELRPGGRPPRRDRARGPQAPARRAVRGLTGRCYI